MIFVVKNKQNIKERRKEMTKELVFNPDYHYDFVYDYEFTDCNPNGDLDNDNMPRTYESGHGKITDVAQKRRIRDFLATKNVGIFVEDGSSIASKMKGLDEDSAKKKYWDLRVFGGVVTDKKNGSFHLTGPIQMSNAKTDDVISVESDAITRCMSSEDKGSSDKNRTIGRKHYIPGTTTYRGNASYSSHYGQKAGVSKEDLEHFLEGLWLGYETNRTASKNGRCVRVVVIEHVSESGRRVMRDDQVKEMTKNLTVSLTGSTLKSDKHNVNVYINPGDPYRLTMLKAA